MKFMNPINNNISGTVFRSARICVFKSCRRSSFSDFLVVWVFESMHIVGLALLFFVVLPEMDVVKGAMLTNCLCFIPGILGGKITFSVQIAAIPCIMATPKYRCVLHL